MMVASSCSIGAGLSMGKIGPSAHIGAMIAKGFSKNTKKMKSDDRLFMTAGAGAGCAAILHAPLAGIAFTLEETNKSFSIEVLLIAISSCITSDFIVSDCFELDQIYYMPLSNSIPIADFWKLILLALIMGLMGVLYNITLQATQKLYSLTKSIWIKIFIPVVATAILVIVFPEITGSFTYLPGIALVCIVSYMVSDLMKSRPVFELLLDKILDDDN